METVAVQCVDSELAVRARMEITICYNAAVTLTSLLCRLRNHAGSTFAGVVRSSYSMQTSSSEVCQYHSMKTGDYM
jgi:hypothetical protein